MEGVKKLKTDYLKQYFYRVLLCVGVLTLSACEEEEIDLSKMTYLNDNISFTPSELLAGDEKEDLSNLPEGMQNGVITPKYYLLLMELIDEITAYSDGNAELKTNTILTEEEIRQERIRLNGELQEYLNSIFYVPTNDVEQEIHEYTKKVMYHLDDMTTYRNKYLEGDESYRQLASDAGDAYLVEAEEWVMLMDKYKLFLEE